ncbi:F-box domain containing protein [Pandoravirus neocaledonia]|uniref:F-box domain containing protein n=1 Tax=Pandoravirus neocaledonia TaxID=2107708 RepID=A0A2U7UCD2_9VIRU|nr:F-box domain containing protein [Pandoravirus neocaledonia]AVK76096.1 F-box domain containing protein [Pandoravirus neocaledonia]
MLLRLPDEILLAIVDMARSTAAWLAGAGATCRRLALLCRDDSLWRSIAVDILGRAAVDALNADSHRLLVRFMCTSTVHVVLCGANSFRDKQRVPRVALRLISVATSQALSKTVCTHFMCPPHKAHVWARQRDTHGPPSPYRLIVAPLVSETWPAVRPWWATAFDRFAVEGEPHGPLSIDVKAMTNPAGCAYDPLSLLRVPQCVVTAASSDLGLVSPYTWYDNRMPTFSLTHVAGCACDAK